MSDVEHFTYVLLDNMRIVPTGLTRYSAGSRVEIRKSLGNTYAVQPISSDPLRIFGEEMWHVAV